MGIQLPSVLEKGHRRCLNVHPDRITGPQLPLLGVVREFTVLSVHQSCTFVAEYIEFAAFDELHACGFALFCTFDDSDYDFVEVVATDCELERVRKSQIRPEMSPGPGSRLQLRSALNQSGARRRRPACR